jgi:exopolysaccharide production protein ExoZ
MKIAVNPTGNIEGLQVLRAIAALMVVLHHARLSVPGSDAWPTFGEAGVDIFFVISGFVMAYTTNPDPRLSMRQRVQAAGMFLRRRVIRVVPLYWLALLWTSRRALVQGQVGTDLAQDFFFIPHPNAAIHTWLAPTLQQGWTLNYEAFFYLLFGAALLFGTQRIRVLLAALLGCVLLGAWLSAAGWPAAFDSPAGIARRFYGDNILLEFGYGVLLQRFMSGNPMPAWPRGVFWVLAAIGLACLGLGHGLGLRGVLEGLPAVLIVWACIQACAGRRMPVFELLGAASYSIYLFHWASFGGAKPIAAALAPMADGPAKVALLMGAHFAVALLAGLVIHMLIEKPFTAWATRRFGGPRHRVPAVLSA